MWRPGFKFEDLKKASISGWERRLWHSSIDHRGSREFPGRVATIVRKKYGLCKGLAYRVHDLKWQETIDYLDEREKSGYKRMVIATEIQNIGLIETVTYISFPKEDWVMPEKKDKDLMRFFLNAVGESGDNLNYLMMLGRTLDQFNIQDEHVSNLLRLLEEKKI